MRMPLACKLKLWGIDSVVASIQTDGVTATEETRWAARFATTALTRFQSDTTKARMLADGELIHGNAGALFRDAARAKALTPADIQRVARQYLGARRLVLSIVPSGQLDEVSKPSLPFINLTPR